LDFDRKFQAFLRAVAHFRIGIPLGITLDKPKYLGTEESIHNMLLPTWKKLKIIIEG
jgi:hypothetical protein